MNNRRMMIALVAALAISGACTLLIGRHISRKPRATAIPQVTYVIAAKPIAAGEVIQAASLKQVAWPKSIPLQGGFQNAASVTGRAALYPVAAGEPLLSADLATPGSGLGIATRIPEGMRAVALRTNDVVAVGGFIYPGSHVDVLVTLGVTNNSVPVTEVVLEDVQVLATGQKTEPDPKGKPTSVDIVTLLLTPEQAERAVLASEKGAIHIVLRNGADQQQVNTPPINLDELAAMPAMASQPGHAAARHISPKPKRYTVVTILGNHTETSSF
ncbi:MAG: Flp pilus assembly protein CpaB [Acidobacteriaceae bacterium]